MTRLLAVIAFACAFATTTAYAEDTLGRDSYTPTIHHARHHRGHYTTVTTSAGIEITGEASFISTAQAVIDDLVAAGYKPRRVSCLNYGASHVSNSLHYRGRACDVDQHGWGRTPAPHSTLTAIVLRHGLRDGCEFRDWGHFDNGPHLPYARIVRSCGAAYAEAVGARKVASK
jgi:hypothetical protein